MDVKTEDYEIRDIDNCYVCSEFMGPFKNELTEVTGYSEKRIFEILEMFIETTLPESVLQTVGICQNCFIKFNDFDLHHTTANQIQMELTLMFRRELETTNPETPVDVKPDIKIEIDDFYFNELVEEIEVLLPEIEKEKTKKKTTDTKSALTAALGKIPRASTHTKVNKDEGLIVYMVDGVKNYQCDFCGKKDFTSRSRLKTHRLIHTSERNYMCQSCGASFKTMNCLKNHSRLHSNIFYNCDLCSSRFKGKHELRCHMDAIHLLRKDHVCQICGKAFSRDKTLRQHLMYHRNERNIVCEICGFKSINEPKMKRHMKSHTGERNYACSLCGKRFLYSYNVTAHIKHVHFHEKRPTTNEEKLICNVCGKKFQKIWRVKEHLAEVHKIVEATDEGIEINTHHD